MIEYHDICDGISASQLHGFFDGWPDRPTPATHLELLRRSSEIVLAIDRDDECVIGFITAITDQVLFAFIPLLEVLPEYRGRGIGSELVRRMLSKLDDLYAVDLVCDRQLQSFYERCGMRPMHAMSLRHYQHQSGRL